MWARFYGRERDGIIIAAINHYYLRTLRCDCINTCLSRTGGHQNF